MLKPPSIVRDNTYTAAQFENIYTNRSIEGNYSSWKINVDSVLITNNSLYGLQTYTYGLRILAMGQTDPIQNGIYSVTNGAWKRANDMVSGISVSGAIVYNNFDGCYYFCSNIQGEDVVGTNELVFLKIDFQTGNVVNYRENALVIKDNTNFKGSYILVSNDNSLAFNGETFITGNEIKTTIPVDINIYANTYETYGDFETNVAPRESNIIFNQKVNLSTIDTTSTFTVNPNQSIMFNYNEEKRIEIKDGGITFIEKYFSDDATLTHNIGSYRIGNIVLSSNIVAASGTLTIVCDCDYTPVTVYANVQECGATQLLNITTSLSGNQFSLLLKNVGNSGTNVDGVRIGFVCFNSPD
jgi:hypothetical protein